MYLSDSELSMAYKDLRRLARQMLASERRDHTLESMELVNRAYVKLLQSSKRGEVLDDPRGTMGLLAVNMRRELIDYARRRRASHRPPASGRITLDDAFLIAHETPEIFLEVARLLELLASGTVQTLDNPSRKVRVSELRFFAGMSELEIARMLGVSRATVNRDINLVTAWIRIQLNKA